MDDAVEKQDHRVKPGKSLVRMDGWIYDTQNTRIFNTCLYSEQY